MLATLMGCSKTGAPYAVSGNHSHVFAYPDFITAN